MNRVVERLRLDRRRLIGIGLAMAAAVLALVATRPPATVDVFIAGRDLAAGAAIPPDAVRHRAVTDPTGLVTAATSLEGLLLRSPVAEGEPLIPSLLRRATAPTPPVALGLEVPAASGVLGRLVPGDRVDVLLTDREAQTSVVARDVRVLEIAEDEGIGATLSMRVLLGTDRSTAALLAGASHRGDIDLIRVGR
jgi:Flp pilus assembly protein CpaB